ncbi:MAG: CinA family protein [Candidatus Omnitrophota bacterium]
MKTKKKIPAEKDIVRILTAKKITLAVAESCTGGLIAHRITNIPGSSACFAGGVIAYSNKTKTAVLGVDPRTIKKSGAVSRETAQAMAKGVRRLLKTTSAIAITGIAGPTGGTAKKPIGLAYISFVSGKTIRTHKVLFKGSRTKLKDRFADTALKLVWDSIGAS